MKSKITFIAVILSALTTTLFAQRHFMPAASHRLCLSVGGGTTMMFGDLKKKVIKPAFKGNFDYNFTPFISAGVEVQAGSLAGGDKDVNGTTSGLYSHSKYTAANANIRLSLGQFFPETQNKFANFIGGAYLGSGMGYIRSNAKMLVRKYSYSDGALPGTFHQQASEIIVPVNVGINMDLSYHIALNLNYQHNFTSSEALDGYDIDIKSNKRDDSYGMISIGLRFYFGDIY